MKAGGRKVKMFSKTDPSGGNWCNLLTNQVLNHPETKWTGSTRHHEIRVHHLASGPAAFS